MCPHISVLLPALHAPVVSGAHVAGNPPTFLHACLFTHPLHSTARLLVHWSPSCPPAVEAEYPGSVKAMLGRWGMVNVKGHQHTRLK